MFCRYCGEPMTIEENGVSHHLYDMKRPGALDAIDYDADADHVPVAEDE